MKRSTEQRLSSTRHRWGWSASLRWNLSLDALALDAVAADIIYTPLETPFLAAAKARGNKTVGGLGMLLHQGPPAWKLWFDVTATVTPDLRALMEASIAGDA